MKVKEAEDNWDAVERISQIDSYNPLEFIEHGHLFGEGFWAENFKQQKWIYGCTPLHLAYKYRNHFKKKWESTNKQLENFTGSQDARNDLIQKTKDYNRTATNYQNVIMTLEGKGVKRDSLTLFDFKTPIQM